MKKITIFTFCFVLFCTRVFGAENVIDLATICLEIQDGTDCILYADNIDTTAEIDGTGKIYYDNQYLYDIIRYNSFKTDGGTQYKGANIIFTEVNNVTFGASDGLGENVIDLSRTSAGIITFNVDESILFSNLKLIDVGRITLQGTDDVENPLVIMVGEGVTSVHTDGFDWETYPGGTDIFISGSLQFVQIRFDDTTFGLNEEGTAEATVTFNGSIDLVVSFDAESGDETETTKETGAGYIADFTFHNEYTEGRISSLKILGNRDCASFTECHNDGNEPTSTLDNTRVSIVAGGVMDISGAVNVADNGALVVSGRLYTSELNVSGAYSYVYAKDSAESTETYEDPVEPEPIYHEGMISVYGNATITATTLFSVDWFQADTVKFSEGANAQIENFDVRDLEFDSSTVNITNLIYFDSTLPEPDPEEPTETIFINEESSLYYQNREGEDGSSYVSSILIKNNSEVSIDKAIISFADITLEDEGGSLFIGSFSSEYNNIFLGKNSSLRMTSFTSSRDEFTLYNTIEIEGDATIDNADFKIYMIDETSGGSISVNSLTFSGYNSFAFMLNPKFVIDKTESSKGKYILGSVTTGLTIEEGTKFDYSVSSVLYKMTDIQNDGTNYYFEYYREKNYSQYLMDVKSKNEASFVTLSETDMVKLNNAIAIGSFLDSRLGAILEDPEGQEVLYTLTLAIDANSSSTEALVNSLSQINTDASGTNYKDIETVATNTINNIYGTFNNKDIENTPWISYILNSGTNDDMDSNLAELLFGFTRSTSDTNFQFGASFGLVGGTAKSTYKKSQYSMLSFAGYINFALSDVSSIDVILIDFVNMVQGDRYIEIIKDMPDYYNPSFFYNHNVQSLSIGLSRRILFDKNMMSTRLSTNIIKYTSFDYEEDSSKAALDASYGNYSLSNVAMDLNYSYYLGYSGDYLLNLGVNAAYYFQGTSGPSVTAGFADSSISQGVDERWNVVIIPFNKYKMGFNISLRTSSFILYLKYSYEGNYQSSSFGINYYKGFAVYSIHEDTEKELKNLL